MKYGKIVNGTLIYAPSPLTVEGMVHYHPGQTLYEAAGYWPVIDTPQPEIPEDADPVPYYTSHWEQQEGQIVKVWDESEAPEPETPAPTLDSRVTALEGETGELYAALNMILEGVTEDGQESESEDIAI